MAAVAPITADQIKSRAPATSRHAAVAPPCVPTPLDLDVGVIYSGERHYMTPLVTSLVESARGIAMRLILLDNCSRDGVADWAGISPQTLTLKNAVACGYAANLNRILRASSARYVLLLNTDMYFDPAEQCLARMVAFMDEEPRCGISICRVHQPDGTYMHPARQFPTWRAIAARRLGLGRVFSHSLAQHLCQHRDRSGSFACDWVSGCFMLVRRDAIQDVGRFDESYVKYFEDVDICRRMTRAGWQVMYNGATSCVHYEQRASRRLLSRDGWLHVRAYLRWLWKWGLSVPASPSLLPTVRVGQSTAGRQRRGDDEHRQTPPAPHIGPQSPDGGRQTLRRRSAA